MKRIPLILALAFVAAMLPAPGWSPLIVDSRVWQRMPAPEQSQIDIRVLMLQRTLERMISLDCYRPDGKRTYCNIAAWDVIDDRPGNWRGYGYMLDDLPLDVSMLFPTAGSIMMCSPQEAYRRASFAEQRGQLELVSMYRAWELARVGEVVLILSARYNHVAIVYPDLRPWVAERGVRVANVGRFNVITDIRHKWVFGKCWRDKEIRMYWIKRLTTDMR
jgi:hypothetical protein